MKRLFCAALAAMMLMAPLAMTGCGDDSVRIDLCEVTHSVFYAPLYVAMNNGYFEERGLTVTLENAGGTDKVTAALVSGSSDIGLMGPEGVLYAEGMQDGIRVFGQLTKRDGSFLVSKKDEADTFEWSDLEGKRVLVGRVGGVPAMTMQYIMNGYGLYDGVNGTVIDTSVAFNMMGSVFDSDDTVDYTTLFEPTATEYERAGRGYVVASVGAESGEVPYTAFVAKQSYLTEERGTAKLFLEAVRQGYEFIKDNDSLTVGEALEPSFDGMTAESLAIAVESYLAIDAWCSTPVMTEESLERLKEIMRNAGELDGDPSFENVVDNSLAEEIVGEG
mgnify:FL=1